MFSWIIDISIYLGVGTPNFEELLQNFAKTLKFEYKWIYIATLLNNFFLLFLSQVLSFTHLSVLCNIPVIIQNSSTYIFLSFSGVFQERGDCWGGIEGLQTYRVRDCSFRCIKIMVLYRLSRSCTFFLDMTQPKLKLECFLLHWLKHRWSVELI